MVALEKGMSKLRSEMMAMQRDIKTMDDVEAGLEEVENLLGRFKEA